jgi:hypothetical protein
MMTDYSLVWKLRIQLSVIMMKSLEDKSAWVSIILFQKKLKFIQYWWSQVANLFGL